MKMRRKHQASAVSLYIIHHLLQFPLVVEYHWTFSYCTAIMTPASTPASSDKERRLDHPSPAIDGAIESVDKMLHNFEGSSFEEVMRERNRIRKEREDYNFAELKVQIARLEDALVAETRRRVDATTKLDDQAREQVYQMEQRLRQQLEHDNEKLQTRIGGLERRLQELEERWTLDSGQQMDSISQKAQEFSKSLEQFQQEHDMERKARLRREGGLLQQVEQHAKEFEDRWNAERQERLDQIAKLEKILTEKETQREREQASFQRRIEEELGYLRSEIDLEAEERQAQDEQIVAALNRYTQQLQNGVSILGDDV